MKSSTKLPPLSSSNYSNSEHQCRLLILQRFPRKSGHMHMVLPEMSEVGTDWHLYHFFNSAQYTFHFIECHFDLSLLEGPPFSKDNLPNCY